MLGNHHETRPLDHVKFSIDAITFNACLLCHLLGLHVAMHAFFYTIGVEFVQIQRHGL